MGGDFLKIIRLDGDSRYNASLPIQNFEINQSNQNELDNHGGWVREDRFSDLTIEFINIYTISQIILTAMRP